MFEKLKQSEHCAKCLLQPRKCCMPIFIPPIDILVVDAFPADYDTEKGAFTGKHGSMVRRLVDKLNNGKIRVAYTYACLCSPDYDAELKQYSINAEMVNHCAVYLKQTIDRHMPKVILALGDYAIKALEFKGKFKDMRGGIYSFKASNGTDIPVVVSFRAIQVTKSPGLIETFKKDLQKAFLLAQDAMSDVAMHIVTPTTVTDIINLLDEANAEINKRFADTGKMQPLALDTETTSLSPYVPEDRVIAVSLSWDDKQGVAFPLEHIKSGFSKDDVTDIIKHLTTLLTNKYAYIVMANAKFDLQWLKHHYGIDVDLHYDVILSEHLLDEDKKGNYSLKKLTRDRLPSAGKYEEEMKNHLDDVWKSKDEEVSRITSEWKEKTDKAIVDWWASLNSDSTRMSYLTKWAEAGYIGIDVCSDLYKIKLRKLKGEYVIPKKYQQSLTKLLSNVQREEFPEDIFPPKPEIDADLFTHSFEDADMQIMLKYAAIDALTTRMICFDQQKDFDADNERVRKASNEMRREVPTVSLRNVMASNTIPLCKVIAHMEYNGVKIDRDRAIEYADIIEKRLVELQNEMYELIGRKFNLSASSPDLANILYDELQLPITKRTEKGDPSTDAETLKELSNDHDLPFIGKLLTWRKLDKCLNTYIKNWVKDSERDGKLHAEFNQIGTATYRLSSNSPNLQNIPFNLKEANLNLKALFLPDSEEYDLYELDVSNAEMRVLTAYSKDDTLIDAFNSGKDLHCLTAAGISNYTYDDLKAKKEDKTSDQYRKRQLAKKINFGTIYGVSAKGLQAQIWSEMRIRESEEQCQEYLDGFFKTYPGVKKYVDSTTAFASRFGFAWTFTGRRRRFASANGGYLSARECRQAVNARIQTTSSDLVTYNLIDVHDWAIKKGGRVLLTVHDSIVFQLPKGITGVKAALDDIIMGKTAERAAWLPVQWVYDAGFGPNYGDAHNGIN